MPLGRDLAARKSQGACARPLTESSAARWRAPACRESGFGARWCPWAAGCPVRVRGGLAAPAWAVCLIRGNGLSSDLITGVDSRSDRNERPPMPVWYARATTLTGTVKAHVAMLPACWRCWPGSGPAVPTGPPPPAGLRSSRSRSRACWPGRRASGRSATRPLTCRGRFWRGSEAGRTHCGGRSTTPLRNGSALLQALDAAALDLLIGGWLAALAAAGRLEAPPRSRSTASGCAASRTARSSSSRPCCTRRGPSSGRSASRTTPPRSPRSGSCWTAWACRARSSPRRRPRLPGDRRVGRQQGRREPRGGLLPDRQGQPASSSGPPSTPSRSAPPATPTTRNWTGATAASSAAPSGSQPQGTRTSRTPPGSPASVAMSRNPARALDIIPL